MSDYSVDPGATIERLIAEREALQVLLTAADELVCERTANLLECGTRRKALEQRVGELLVMLRMAWVDTEVSADNCRRIDAALKPAEGRGDE